MKISKPSKPFTFFILMIIIMAFSPILVRGATALSNPTRTPSLEGNVDYDYDSDYTCDYTLQIDFPPRTVSYFWLYYRINAGSWVHTDMSVLDANTYKLDDCSPDDMGAIPSDDIDYYFYIEDSEGASDTTATYSFSVNEDLVPPTISNVGDDASYPEETDSITVSATVTDDIDVSYVYVLYRVNSGSWNNESMSEGGSNVWSKNIGTFSYDDDVDYFVQAKDSSSNVAFSDDYATDELSDAMDFIEGDTENFAYSHTTTRFETENSKLIIEAPTSYGFKPTGAPWGSESDPTWEYDIDFTLYTTFFVYAKSNVSDSFTFKLDSYYGSYSNPSMAFSLTSTWTLFSYDISEFTRDSPDGVMLWTYGSSTDIQVKIDYMFIIKLNSFSIYDWDVPVYGGTTATDPATNIENDDSVTISNSALYDGISGYTSGNAKVYYFDGSWGTETMTGTSPATANIGTFDYDDTITYAFEVMDNAGMYRYYQQIGTEINENDDNWVNNAYFSSVTSTQTTDNEGYIKCTTQARTDGGAYYRVKRTGWSVDTTDYYWFFMRWKVSTTTYEWKLYGIRDSVPQYISRSTWGDNYYQNYHIDGNDGWVTTYGFIDSDFRASETEIQLVFTPNTYPNQNVSAGEHIDVDYFYLVDPDSFSIVDITNPEADTPTHSPATPLDTQDVTLYCDASDTASGVDTVRAYWRIDEGDWDYGLMSGSGTYSYNIGTFNYDEVIEYWFKVYDNEANFYTLDNSGSYYTFTCEDTEDPTISDIDFSPDYPKETSSITISATITDNDNVYSGDIYYRINGAGWIHEVMSEGGSNVWSKDIGTFSIDDVIEFYIKATDDYGNDKIDNNSGNYYTITVTDQDTPSLTNLDHSPESPDNTDDITISVTISDNDDVTNAYLLWSVNGGGWNNDSMSEGGANVWSKNIGNLNDLDFLEYYVQAFDPSGNTIFSNDYATTELSDTFNFIEGDTEGFSYTSSDLMTVQNGYAWCRTSNPTGNNYLSYGYPSDPYNDASYTILMYRFKEINNYPFSYQVKDGVTSYAITGSVTSSSNVWQVRYLPFTDSRLQTSTNLQIVFWYYGDADQTETLDIYIDCIFIVNLNSVTVEDIENPELDDWFMDYCNASSDLTGVYSHWWGSIAVTDNVEIDTVILYYRVNSGNWIAVEIEWFSGDNWLWNMTELYDEAGVEYGDYLWQRFWVNDTSGNTCDSRWCWLYFEDLTDPNISDISNTPENPLRLQDVTINCTVEDNGNIDYVTVYWRIDDGEWSSANMTNYSGDYYSYMIGSFAINEVIDYYIKAWDTYANYDTSSTYEIDLTDDVNPVVVTPTDNPYNDYFLNETLDTCNFTEDYEGFTFTYGQSREAGVLLLNPNDETPIYMNNTMSFNSDVYYILTIRAKKGALGGMSTWLKIDTTHIGSLTTSYQTFELDLRGTWNGWQSFLCLNVWDDLGLATIYIDWIEIKTTHIIEDYSFEGSNIYYYNVTDLNAKEYEVFRNGTTYQSSSWTSGVNIQITITDNINSVYNFTAVFTDWANNIVILTILIITLDETVPTFNTIYHDPNTPSEKTSVSMYVTLTDNDDVTHAYLLWRINLGNWNNNSLSEGDSNIWSYAIGLHSINDDIDYYIQARDPNNNLGTDDNSGSYYNVVVTDQETPVISSPDNIEYIREHTGYSISWTVTDNHHGTYIIYLDGVSVDSSTWTSGNTITIVIDNLIEGEHNYTISLQDEAEHLVTDYVLVTVNQKPVITETEDPIIPPPDLTTPPPLIIADIQKPVAWGTVGLLLLTSASLLFIRIKRSREKKKKGSDYD